MKSRLPGVVFAALSVLAFLVSRHDATERRAVMAFADRYGFPVRHAAWRESALLAPTFDIATDVVAVVALGDALDVRRWSELTPDEKQAWLSALAHMDEELRDAGRLLADAVRARPGWAYHRLLLGQVAYVAERRQPDSALRDPAGWIVPLRMAAAAAPGEDAIAPFLAGALLESWPILPDSARAAAPPVLRRAFRDPAFVSRALLPARALLGAEAVPPLLPDDVETLRTARDVLGRAGFVPDAALVDARWEAAERRMRAADLAAIRQRGARGDTAALKGRCRDFVRRHGPGILDGPAERRELGEVLALWPPEESGGWRSDPRGDVVRFFLEGHVDDARPEVLSSAIEALTEVPAPERAMGRLLAGDRPGFDALVTSAEAKGALGFTRVFVEAARRALRDGKPDAARDALAFLSPRAAGECEVLLVRRELARASGSADELRRAEGALDAATGREMVVPAAGGGIPVCVDPERTARGVVAVRFRADKPALVAWGFRGSRLGSFLLEAGETERTFPLEGERGLTALTFQVVAGARPEPLRVSYLADAAAQPAPATAQSVAAVAGSERLKSTTP